MARIFLLGDTHCDARFAAYAVDKAAELEADYILQLGDFGWWPGMYGFKTFLNVFKDTDIPVHFLAGNHENWESLIAEELNSYINHNRTVVNQFLNIAPNVYYAPTGLTWEWDGVTFMSVGGAYSIDKDGRTPGIDWFPQEMINDKQVAFCNTKGKIDVLVSHDTPQSVDMGLEFAKLGRTYLPIGDTKINREQLQRIVDVAQPSHIYHGHWHMDYVQHVDSMRVEGLHCNFKPEASWTILDTEGFHDRIKE